jgi:hypothetical protein
VVNSTAQIALQARKYGLGFMVITQRTALGRHPKPAIDRHLKTGQRG